MRGSDSAKFLEEKLEILGLNYKEKEEFIVYWLPKLESHNYNYIYFATEEEIEKEMPLEFSVKPDTLIRIRMIFEGLDDFKEVKEQTLTPAPERNGFTVVEWGGTDLTVRDNWYNTKCWGFNSRSYRGKLRFFLCFYRKNGIKITLYFDEGFNRHLRITK
ncbi:hypothetical protein IKG33_00415 [Candidatus Saccharibacteria bacterium]|nr:hypothetical protein [Candidatus Saccharibacteria bacterium]